MENILQQSLNNANNLLNQNKFQEAKEAFQFVIERIPPELLKDNIFLLFNLGICELKLNNIKNSIDNFLIIYGFYQSNKV